MKREGGGGSGKRKIEINFYKKSCSTKLMPSPANKRAIIVGMSCQFETKSFPCIPLTLHLHKLSAIEKGLLRAAIELGEVLEALPEEP